MLSKEPKIWLTVKDMTNEYPLSERQIRRRLSDATIPESKIKKHKSKRGFPTKKYHYTITDSLLKKRRRLSKNEKDKTIRLVNNQCWRFIGNIVPEGANINVNISIIMQVFNELKELSQKRDLKLFYSVESNPNDSFYHTHFLINSDSSQLTLREVRVILEKYIPKNTYKERRIDLKKYESRYGKGGSVYTSKRNLFSELLEN